MHLVRSPEATQKDHSLCGEQRQQQYSTHTMHCKAQCVEAIAAQKILLVLLLLHIMLRESCISLNPQNVNLIYVSLPLFID